MNELTQLYSESDRKFGRKEKKVVGCISIRIENTKPNETQGLMYTTRTRPIGSQICTRTRPKAVESHQCCHSPLVAPEPGMGCHLEMGWGFVKQCWSRVVHASTVRLTIWPGILSTSNFERSCKAEQESGWMDRDGGVDGCRVENSWTKVKTIWWMYPASCCLSNTLFWCVIGSKTCQFFRDTVSALFHVKGKQKRTISLIRVIFYFFQNPKKEQKKVN